MASRDAGIHAEAGILAPEPWTARLQLRDSAGLAPDFPHFSLTPSDEALCCAFGCRGTLPRGPAVVKDARLASDYGRIVPGSFSAAYRERAREHSTAEPYAKAIRNRNDWAEPLFVEAKYWLGLLGHYETGEASFAVATGTAADRLRIHGHASA